MIHVKGLSKSFKLRKQKNKKNTERDPREDGRWFHALKDISFKSEQGQILGLLGPNGAGKTTMLRLLSTALQPTQGTAEIHGTDISAEPLKARKMIGFLSGNTGLYGRLSPTEMVRYYGRLHGMSRGDIETRMHDLFTRLDMNHFCDKRNDSLSTGMKQKVSIARTLIHDPDVIIFDEPTTGLDVAAAESILNLITQCRERGKTVLFSTHHMHEVERLCEDVVILHQGQLQFHGSVSTMKEQTGEVQLDRAFLALIGREVTHAA